ncbi:MAG: DUF3857 domain-containing protein [Rhodothermales bacterium]|nr:DUF3857 domain-containing protein [Rhodothermales bacterium]
MLYRLFPSRALFALLALALAHPLFAQSRPSFRWGQIPEDQLAMTAFPADTNAAAVVLAEVGKVSFDVPGRRKIYEVHRRVKLLRSSAFDAFGTISLTFPSETRVSEIEGQTFVPNPAGGSPQRFRLSRDGIFREDVRRGIKRVRFTLPNLAEGAVIEYRYQVTNEDLFSIPAWSFQNDEPTLWSEYRVTIPEILVFTALSNNFSTADLVIDEHRRVPGATDHRWAMADVPALREEPFMTTLADYERILKFQLAAVNVPGAMAERFANTWPRLGTQLMGPDGYLAKRVEVTPSIRDQAAAVAATATTPEEKMNAIYTFVRTNIAYNGDTDALPDETADDVLRAKRGSSPEVNSLLVAMLRSVGLDATPTLLSSRDHGRVSQTYPYLGQFNDLIAHVAIGSDVYLLDATNPLRPASLLPPNSLGGAAWLVRPDGGAWVPLNARSGHRRLTNVTATLAADGTLTGTVNLAEADYGALARRSALRDVSDEPEHIRKEWLDDLPGLTLNGPVLHEKDVLDRAIRLETGFSLPDAANSTGDLLYFVPQVFGRVDENPLKNPTRTFPLDLGYTRDYTFILALTLPEGYEVAELPANRRLGVDGAQALFQRSTESNGSTLRITQRFQLGQTIYPAARYGQMRRFWDEVVAASEEPIVLRRKADALPPSGN